MTGHTPSLARRFLTLLPSSVTYTLDSTLCNTQSYAGPSSTLPWTRITPVHPLVTTDSYFKRTSFGEGRSGCPRQ